MRYLPFTFPSQIILNFVIFNNKQLLKKEERQLARKKNCFCTFAKVQRPEKTQVSEKL